MFCSPSVVALKKLHLWPHKPFSNSLWSPWRRLDRCFVLFKAASVEFRSSTSLFAFNYFLHLINTLMICVLDVWTLIVVGMMRYWFCVFDVYQIFFVHWTISYSTDLDFKKLLIKVVILCIQWFHTLRIWISRWCWLKLMLIHYFSRWVYGMQSDVCWYGSFQLIACRGVFPFYFFPYC